MPLLCLVVVLSLSATATRGANILFVSSMTAVEDDALKAFMEGLGHTVTYIDDDEDEATTEAAAAAADLVFISESVGSGGIKNEITEIETPMIVGEPWAWDEMGLTVGDGGDDPAVTTDAEIVDPGHYLAAGLSGTVAILTDILAGGNLGKGITGPEATVIATATLSDTVTYDVIFVYEKGAALPVAPADGSAQVAADIRIGFGFHSICYPVLSDNAYALLGAAVDYALGLTGPELANPVHSYTFEDGTANDSVGSAHGTLIGDAAVVGGALVLDGDGDWMSMPGEVIAMNTYSEVTVETWFTSVAGGNTGFHMLAAFGEEGTGANPGFGYKYLFITPARGDDVSRAAIQTSSMDDSPWDEETGVSATVEHDDGIEHHFVATVDATNITFYIDGVLIGSEPLAAGNEIAGIGQAVAYLGKGVYTVDPLWTGSINELNIYDRALSLGQVESNYAAGPVKPLVHRYTFEDGTANDSVGSAHGTLVGDAAVVDGALVLDGDGDWMDMPGDVIAMNTFEGLTIEIMFTSVAGGNTGFHMVTAFGEEGTGDNPGYGYKYVCITPARGNDVSRGMIQTVSMDNDPWSEETGVSDVIEHDDGLPHHMVCTVDNTELAFYVDGVLIGTAALDPPGNSIAGIGTDAAHIGKGVYGVDPLWAGSVEELSIYNRALSLAEVQTNYAAGPQKVGPAPVDPGTEGLMLHLPLDTASRGVTQDSSDNDLDGTLFGDPTFVEGVVIMALEFDGVDDYVDCGNSDILNFGTGDWTVSAWIKTVQSGTGDENKGTIFANGGDQSGGIRYTLAVSETEEGIVTLTTDDDATKVQATSSVLVNDDAWHHVVGMRSGTDLIVYVDGVLDVTNTVPDGYDLSGTSQHNAYVGVITDNRDGSLSKSFAGLIDEVRIYDRALSAQEVLFLAGI